MVRALVLVIVASALALHSTSEAALLPFKNFNTLGKNCSAPAIWSGVARRPTTPAPPTTSAPRSTSVPHTTSRPVTTTSAPTATTVPPDTPSPDEPTSAPNATTVPPDTSSSDAPTASETAEAAPTTAGPEPHYDQPAPASASGIWVAYLCDLVNIRVHDVLANRPLWSTYLPRDQTFTPAFGPDGSVYVSSSTNVYKFDLLTGKQLWTQSQGRPFVGPAQVAADVVVVPVTAGAVAFVNATTSYYLTRASVSNPVTSGKYVAGVTDKNVMQFFVDGRSTSTSFPQAKAPTAGYGDIICASQQGSRTGVFCVNTNKAPSRTYSMSLNTTLPFAMAGETLVVGIDSSGTAQRCFRGSCYRTAPRYNFSAGVSAPRAPVPENTTSYVIFGVAALRGDDCWLVGFSLNDRYDGYLLNSSPVGLPSAVFDNESRVVYVAVTLSNNMIYVFKS